MIGLELTASPKVWTLGHRQTGAIWRGTVYVQEKLDGSQVSFQRTGEDTFRLRSKGVEQDVDKPDKMFGAAVAAVRERLHHLTIGAIYRGEYLSKPKHNVMHYPRIPNGHIALFDVVDTVGEYLTPDDVARCAWAAKFDVVPNLDVRRDGPPDELLIQSYLGRKSFLGGPIEGVVFKNYGQFAPVSGDPIFAKVVRDEFKEQHKRDWNVVPKKDVIEKIGANYNNHMRWLKGVQRLRESGELSESPADIGKLFKAVHADIEEECAEEIKDILWNSFRKKILKGATLGLPEWYKEQLLRSSLEDA